MELSKNFEPKEIEIKWNDYWKTNKYFESKPDRRPAYTVVIPPPNVTGVLHMGHTLNETVQDILVRRARMNGFNACWVPGSDHASIATEAKVVQMLKEKGIDKNTLSREDFLKYAFEWKEKYGGIIYNQIERLGCSVDWSRVTFTMDDHYYKAVIKVFIDLFKKGLIYRGARMINWDPSAKTALSDEEVEYREVQSKLYHVQYKLDGQDGYITIATTRPETILGDTAICVHPEDERYLHLKGAYAFVPLINRRIPIIFDEYVDKEFGTGALKITPAHDINDYNIGLKHHLEVIDTLNDDGTLSTTAQLYIGEDRFEVRKKIAIDLEAAGALVKTEDIVNKNGFSQRSNAVVEPKISTQWFLKMKDMAQPALDAVVNGDIKIHPGDRFLATYKYWLENVKDWCISRQLWWGQQIPAWYDADGNCYVAETEAEAKLQAQAAKGTEVENLVLRQDEDVLDTWFSSWLWPSEVFHGITNPGNEEVKYYYPTSVLVTGQDIIFFWVARMVMAGMEYEKEIPFKDVYFTGMVRDKQGRKMSKSLGNSPDLLELIDKYGADAVRFGIMISAPAGNDLLFDEASLEQGRNFNNKMWNALKLIKMWEQNPNGIINDEAQNDFANQWMQHRILQAKAEISKLQEDFKLSEALKQIYNLIWDDFCAWYLEWQKPAFGAATLNSKLQAAKKYFAALMQLLHPYMPFITEELNVLIDANNQPLAISQFDALVEVDKNILAEGALLQSAISTLRDIRVKNNIKPKDPMQLFIEAEQQNKYQAIQQLLMQQGFLSSIEFTDKAVEKSINTLVNKDRYYIVPATAIDTTAQKETLQKEIEYLQGFLVSVEKKLSNERFVQNAKPEIVDMERKKKADAEEKIKALTDSIASL
ncbi:MAG: valine--tRNA ligase [Bacteroidia bacterium]|nr:MAG: valine--tRNA ligase [Bacteroidia bacterium]